MWEKPVPDNKINSLLVLLGTLWKHNGAVPSFTHGTMCLGQIYEHCTKTGYHITKYHTFFNNLPGSRKQHYVLQQ
jgi:hypothetical protein